MAPFEAKGAEPLWKPVYDWGCTHSPGELLTWETLIDLLGYDPSRPGLSRHPIHTASKRLLDDRQKMLVSVRGEGYRIAEASEHFSEAKKGQKSAQRKMGQAVDIAAGGDRNQLTPEAAKNLDELHRVLANQYAMLSRLDTEVREIQVREQARDDRWDVLERTLKAHGIELPDSTTVEGETVPQES